MKIYTRTGDGGETHLFAGPRVAKDHPRIEACGAIDELNALLGLARAESASEIWEPLLDGIQADLMNAGAQIATPDPGKAGTEFIHAADVQRLEETIDRFEAQLTPLTRLILPGGTPLACRFHQARTVCRRAERRVVTLIQGSPESISTDLLRYLNRLSDLLFVLARFANHQQGVPDVIWQPPRP
jgi:cob(I)alamin adenosyltransferase